MSMPTLSHEEKTKYIKSFARSVLNEVFELIDSETKVYGPEMTRAIVMTMISTLIGTLVKRSLENDFLSAEGPSSSLPDALENDRQYAQLCEQYGLLKEHLQEAIAEGFTGGFYNFNPDGDLMDFICKIKPIDAKAGNS